MYLRITWVGHLTNDNVDRLMWTKQDSVSRCHLLTLTPPPSGTRQSHRTYMKNPTGSQYTLIWLWSENMRREKRKKKRKNMIMTKIKVNNSMNMITINAATKGKETREHKCSMLIHRPHSKMMEIKQMRSTARIG